MKDLFYFGGTQILESLQIRREEQQFQKATAEKKGTEEIRLPHHSRRNNGG